MRPEILFVSAIGSLKTLKILMKILLDFCLRLGVKKDDRGFLEGNLTIHKGERK